MRHAVSIELYGYWSALRSGAHAPERNEVEPGAIQAILPDTFVLDYNPTGGFPLRICGSRVSALFLKELRGASFLHIWRDEDHPAIASILRTAADKELPLALLAEAHPHELAPVRIEVTVLPLRRGGATHARMLGALAADVGNDFRGSMPVGPIALKSHRVLPVGQTSSNQDRVSSAYAADGNSVPGSTTVKYVEFHARRLKV